MVSMKVGEPIFVRTLPTFSAPSRRVAVVRRKNVYIFGKKDWGGGRKREAGAGWKICASMFFLFVFG